MRHIFIYIAFISLVKCLKYNTIHYNRHLRFKFRGVVFTMWSISNINIQYSNHCWWFMIYDLNSIEIVWTFDSMIHWLKPQSGLNSRRFFFSTEQNQTLFFFKKVKFSYFFIYFRLKWTQLHCIIIIPFSDNENCELYCNNCLHP